MIEEQALRSIFASGKNMDAEEYREHVATHYDVTFYVMCMIMVAAEWDDIGTNEIQEQVEAWLGESGTTLKSPLSNPNGWWSRAWTEFKKGLDTPFTKNFRPEYCEVLDRKDGRQTRYAIKRQVRPLVEKLIHELG